MPYQLNYSVETPPDDAIAWRFMSLGKFVSVVTTSTLWLCSVEALQKNDPFEGSLSNANFDYLRSLGADDSKLRTALGIDENRPIEPYARRSVTPEVQEERCINNARSVYANCWHLNEHESAVLWSVYAGSGEGVCVKSSIGRIKSSLSDVTEQVYIGKVRYLNYDTELVDMGHIYNLVLSKRMSYKAEDELRIFVYLPPFAYGRQCGISVACDTSALIDEVLVSPTSEKWYEDAVRSLVNKLGLKCRVNKSPLTSRNIV